MALAASTRQVHTCTQNGEIVFFLHVCFYTVEETAEVDGEAFPLQTIVGDRDLAEEVV